MEFEDMKKIWDSQNHEALYAINEKALHGRILAKKERSRHIANFSELLLIVVNLVTGAIIVTMSLDKGNGNIYLYLLSAWMFFCALYVIIHRELRAKRSERFDRSMRGELDHAISMASRQVHLSQFGRWNMVPVVLLMLLSLWDGGKSIWLALGMLLFAVVLYYAARWEHNIYVRMENELKHLRNKLEAGS
jgi:hypothetical protein